MSDNSLVGVVLIIVAGAAAAGFGGYMWMEQGERINSYESTEATVVSSEVYEEISSSSSDSGTERSYYPEVTYEYTVDGETHESENVFPGPGESSTGENKAETIVENHPEGETVTAYYDPENPSNSFLIKKQQIMFLGIAAFGGLFVLAGLGSLGKRVLGLAM